MSIARILLVIMLVQSFPSSALAQASPPNPDVVEFLVNEDPRHSQNVLPDPGHLITTMTYHRAEHQIHVEKRCFVDLNGLIGITVEDRPKLANYDYFLRPTLITSRRDLLDSFKKRTPVDGQSWRVDFNIELITEGMRVAAANAINLRYPGANVSHERVKLIPFRFLDVRADLGSGMQRVTSLPSISVTSKLELPPLINTPNQIHVRLIGSEESLRQFVNDPKLEGRCFIKGLALKENILNLSADVMVKTGLNHVLSGNASWEQFIRFRTDAQAIKPNDGKIAMKSLVTRSQVREVSTVVASRVRGIIFETNGTSVELPLIRDKFLDHLLRLASEQRLTEIVKEGKNFVIDRRLAKDLNSDQYTLLNATMRKHVDEKSEKSQAGGAFGIELKSGTKKELKDENDITWMAEGEVIVPKRIDLYQFNQALFKDNASFQFVEASAVEGGLNMTIPPAIGPFGVELTINHFRFVNVDDDDEDMKGFSLLIEFLDAAGTLIPESSWKQERGLISVGDRDRERYRTPRQLWVREGSGEYPTDFFNGTSKSVALPVSKIRIRVSASTDDNGTPGEWVPFEKEFDLIDRATIILNGGWLNGSTLNDYDGRHIEVQLTTKDL